MLPQTDDMIYNWRNELRQNVQGEQFVAVQAAENYKQRGFTAAETLEMLAADSYDLRIAEAAVKSTYEPESSAPAADKARTAQVVPTSYNDVAPIIENTLSRLSAREFVDRLTKSEAPLMRVTAASVESLQRLAAQAKEDAYALSVLHDEIRPWIEDAMLKSVLLAEKEPAQVTAMGKNSSRFKVASRKEVAEVDLESGVSTGSRFQKGHFAEFGLADEFMVRAADVSSPYQRLKRALNF